MVTKLDPLWIGSSKIDNQQYFFTQHIRWMSKGRRLQYQAHMRKVSTVLLVYGKVGSSAVISKCRSPPPVIPPLPLLLISKDTPTYCTSFSEVNFPSACGTPCGGICSIPSQCAVPSPMFPTHTAEPPVPPPHRFFPRSEHPHPPFSTHCIVAPNYVTPSVGCTPPLSSRCPTPI